MVPLSSSLLLLSMGLLRDHSTVHTLLLVLQDKDLFFTSKNFEVENMIMKTEGQ